MPFTPARKLSVKIQFETLWHLRNSSVNDVPFCPPKSTGKSTCLNRSQENKVRLKLTTDYCESLLSHKDTLQAFSAPTEIRAACLSQRKLWEAMQSVKLLLLGDGSQERLSPQGGPPWVSLFPLSLARAAADQLQWVSEPETEGRIVPFGEGLDPNQDI